MIQQITRRRLESWPAPVAELQLGALSFTAHSTFGTFVGTTTVVNGGINGNGDLRTARGWVETPVGTLSTRNALRDRDLRAALDAANYPMIRFDLRGVEVDGSSEPPNVTRAELHERLTIRGVSRRVTVPVSLLMLGNEIYASGTFALDLVDYRIGVSRFFGTLRLERRIEVRFNLQFVRIATEVAA